MTAADAVEIRDLSKRFGHGADQVVALDAVTLTIRENEFFTLLGPSGCGKTTLLRLIAGFEQPSNGEIALTGRPLAGLPPFKRPVNTVFQSYALFPHLTVARNISFGLEMQNWEPARIERRVEEMLALVKLEGMARRRPAQLSGGQQQRVALARALANQPQVLLLDEPLSALDLKLRKEMQLELKRLQSETGITFIFVTHDQEEALTMSDRIAVIHDGRVLQVGTPKEVYEHPTRRFVADFIGESNFIDAVCDGVSDSQLDCRLPSGAELRVVANPAATVQAGQTLTLAVRPERAGLSEPGQGLLRGKVEQVVYFGTDTNYYVALDGGGRFQLRQQNRDGATAAAAVGDEVGIAFPPEAAQALAD